jgi:uncharacterized membrane protein YbhN (UPF0104 family)
MRAKLFLAIRIAVALTFAWIAIGVLVNEFGDLSTGEVIASLSDIGWGAAALMLLATLAAYLAISTYDAFALRYGGISLRLRRSMVSSTASYAISNVLGFPVFTGNAVRFWLYETWGLGARETALAAIVTTVACNHALAIIAGVSLIAAPDSIALAGLDVSWGRPAGLVILVTALALAAFAMFGQGEIRIWKLHVHRPGLLLAPHLAVCAVDYLATAVVLYIPLGQMLDMDLLSFVVLFSIAKTIGIVSNVPGGLGVFEAIMASAAREVPAAELAAALIAFRVIFYLAPFGIAAAAVAVHGLARTTRRTASGQPSTPSE